MPPRHRQEAGFVLKDMLCEKNGWTQTPADQEGKTHYRRSFGSAHASFEARVDYAKQITEALHDCGIYIAQVIANKGDSGPAVTVSLDEQHFEQLMHHNTANIRHQQGRSH